MNVPSWSQLLLVGLGGACGAMARYVTTVAATGWWGERFPYGTLIVNVAGCLAIGLLLRLSTGWVGDSTRLMLSVGVLGGLTTFSTFGMDTVSRLQQGAWGTALANVAANLGFGLSAVALGIALGAWLSAEGTPPPSID
ncbi:MAG TPA: fluoride efflux transporter CrcB [Pirellulaceae bacterium]|nr:fluoride efflux transporter CrcB [Pirellulaceae bacterium]